MSAGKPQQSVLAQGRDAPDRDPHRAVTPVLAIARWPADRPLAVLNVGSIGDAAGAAPRWTILTSPTPARAIHSAEDLDALLAPTEPTGPGQATEAPPFRSGRLVALAYHAGNAFEPVAGTKHADQGPLGYVLECPATLAYDHARGAWRTQGDPTEAAALMATLASLTESDPLPPRFTLTPLVSETGEAGYRAMVQGALGLIAAGDVYQVNLAHRLAAAFTGSTRAFAAALFGAAMPLHGVCLELPGEHPVALCSVSPELFLSFDPSSRTVRTSPMKGTRPITGDAEELRTAEKDRAELNMITDLMRNDLGRVCDFGTLRVEHARTIEAHGRSVLQATSTVSGRLRDGLNPADLIGATFPPGSVTGAPKVRAMQIIDDLEPAPRGFYCGSMGWLDDSGAMSLSVGIRTAQIENGELAYHAGAGIVADSEPGAEWAETLEKAEILRRLSGD